LTNYNPYSTMTMNKFVPDSLRPVSERLLNLITQLSDFNTAGQGLNSKVKRTYHNPTIKELN